MQTNEKEQKYNDWKYFSQKRLNLQAGFIDENNTRPIIQQLTNDKSSSNEKRHKKIQEIFQCLMLQLPVYAGSSGSIEALSSSSALMPPPGQTLYQAYALVHGQQRALLHISRSKLTTFVRGITCWQSARPRPPRLGKCMLAQKNSQCSRMQVSKIMNSRLCLHPHNECLVASIGTRSHLSGCRWAFAQHFAIPKKTC